MGREKKRQKHVPQRTCVVCREKKDKRLLTRIVRSPDSGVIVDPTGKRNGRGAYLCSRIECWEMALNGKALDQSLRVELSDEERQELLTQRPTEIDGQSSFGS